MADIKYKYQRNSDDIFLRHVFAGLTETLTDRVKYTQVESDDVKRVITVPFYFSTTGQERFLHYYFSGKDYETCEEYVEGSFDVVPRGVLTLENSGINSGEITSPFSRGIFYEVDDTGAILSYSSYIKSVPLRVNFSLEIRTSTQNENWKLYQSIIKELYFVRRFNFLYNGLVVPAQVSFPDNIENEGKLFKFTYGELEKPTQKLSLECETYLPVIDDDAKIFSGNRINVFKHNYIDSNNEDQVENLELELYGRLGGRILYEEGATPYEGTINLIDASNTVISSATLEDGYYFFNKISPKIGYRIEDQETSTILKDDIVVYPNDNRHLDFEV